MKENKIIPVALFTYARPKHLLKTLGGLRRNAVPLIYAFCDAPKDETKVTLVKEVKEILYDVNWTEIIIIERKTNLGLGTSIRSGVTEVFKKYDKLIVIEDDIMMRPGAYDYTCAALNHYEKDDRVMTVTMWNHPVMVPKNAEFGFFSERFMCWGWGTYKKYWQLYSESIQEIFDSLDDNLKDHINEYGKDLFQQVNYAKRANIWYVGYAMLHFKFGKLSFFPYETLVINIGKDETAENDGPGKTSYTDNEDLINIPVKLIMDEFPEPVLYAKTRRLFNKYFYLKHPLTKRIWLKLKRKMYFLYKPIKKYLN